MRTLHLTDIHISAALGPDAEGVDARAVLEQLLHDCRHLGEFDLLVVSGDIADDGSRQGYADALSRIGSFATAHGAAQAWCVGNHDVRPEFRSVLGNGHFDAAGSPGGHALDAAAEVCAAVSVVSGYRVITLDSLISGRVDGRVDADQLSWLRSVLAEPSENGSIVVLHHPPVTLDLPLQKAVGLQNADQLSEVIEGSDVRIVLCGHFHVQLTGMLGSIPVWVGPGVASRVDLTAPANVERAVRGAAATVIDLGFPASPLIHTLHARDEEWGAPVYLVDAMSGADLENEGSD